MTPLKGDAGFRYFSSQGAELLTFPGAFDNAAWTKARATVTADATTAPDGTTTADKLVEDTSASTTHVVYQSGVVSGTTYVLSGYAKKAERNVRVVGQISNSLGATFDLDTGAVLGASPGIEDGAVAAALSDGWWRLSITWTATASTSCGFYAATDSFSYTGDGTSGVYLWGASLTEVTQVEVALEHPLFRITPAASRVRYEAWSLDRTAREVVTIGDGVKEINGTVRLHADPIELLAMLEAGANGTELTYFPSLAANVGYPCQLVEPSGEYIETLRDSSSLGKIGRYEVPVRLRRVDGGTWENLF